MKITLGQITVLDNLTSVGVIQSELNIMLRWFADDCDNVSSDGIFEICGVDLLSNDFGIEVSSDVNFIRFIQTNLEM